MEPDCAFYVGKRAREYREALIEGEAAATAFVEQSAPDLVVEVEITSADEGKVERYGEMGVRELWRLHGAQGVGGTAGGLPRAAARQRTAQPRRVGTAPGIHAGRHVRGGWQECASA